MTFSPKAVAQPVEQTALSAATLCHTYRLATAAASVYATAREHGAALLTGDTHLNGWPGVTLSANVMR